MINNNKDPLSSAVETLFGLSYLFPYQRLVITNILEAAQAAGIPVNWPQQAEVQVTEGKAAQEQAESEKFPDKDISDKEFSDRECLGRQIVILPTGAGKSLCFQLPAMLTEGVTLVIYPILSLMADQERRLRTVGSDEHRFSPVILRGGQSKKERDEIWQKLKNGESKFIIANPEILLTAKIKEQLQNVNVTHVVIDEAHCVSEWGESFRPSYLEIGSIINSLNPPLVTAFTATASAPVLEKIRNYIFGDLEVHQIVGNPDRPNICYSAAGCINRNLAVRDLLIKNTRPAIVFCSSRPGTEKLAHYLRNEFGEMGFPWHKEIRFYHAGLSREEKTDVEKWFIGNREAVLCATCAYGMGVDKADVRTVIHRDCAPSVEAYLQEAGRAGRDGEQSKAFLLWGPDDKTALIRAKTEADKARISALLHYARDTEHCRRHSLLALLDYNSSGEVPEKLCCDVCENEADNALREELSVMGFFRKNKRRFSSNEATSILAAVKSIRWSKEEAKEVIDFLLKEKKLKMFKHFPLKDKLTLSR